MRVFACGYTLDHNLMQLSNQWETNRNSKPRETNRQKHNAEAKITDAFVVNAFFVPSFCLVGLCGHEVSNGQKWSGSYFQRGQPSTAASSFSIHYGPFIPEPLSPSWKSHPRFTFSLNCISLSHFFPPKPLLFLHPVSLFSPRLTLLLFFSLLLSSCTIFSPSIPSSVCHCQSIPEPQSHSCHQLKQERDKFFSSNALEP